MSFFADKVLCSKPHEQKKTEHKESAAYLIPIVAIIIIVCWLFVCYKHKISLSKPQKVEVNSILVQNSYTEKDGMPYLIYFSGKQWEIIADNKYGWDHYLLSEHADGATFCSDHVIAMRSNLPISRRRDTLLHELLHVGACGAGTQDQQARYYNSKSMEDHTGIERISSVYSEFFLTNPELVKYLSTQK